MMSFHHPENSLFFRTYTLDQMDFKFQRTTTLL